MTKNRQKPAQHLLILSLELLNVLIQLISEILINKHIHMHPITLKNNIFKNYLKNEKILRKRISLEQNQTLMNRKIY